MVTERATGRHSLRRHGRLLWSESRQVPCRATRMLRLAGNSAAFTPVLV